MLLFLVLCSAGFHLENSTDVNDHFSTALKRDSVILLQVQVNIDNRDQEMANHEKILYSVNNGSCYYSDFHVILRVKTL